MVSKRSEALSKGLEKILSQKSDYRSRTSSETKRSTDEAIKQFVCAARELDFHGLTLPEMVELIQDSLSDRARQTYSTSKTLEDLSIGRDLLMGTPLSEIKSRYGRKALLRNQALKQAERKARRVLSNERVESESILDEEHKAKWIELIESAIQIVSEDKN